MAGLQGRFVCIAIWVKEVTNVTHTPTTSIRRPIEPVWAIGTLESVNMSPERHQPKQPVSELRLVPDHGVESDAHAGEYRVHAVKEPIKPNTRQVSLMDARLLETWMQMGYIVGPGLLGENLTVRGIPLDDMAPGDRLYCGPVVLEVTENRIPCTTLPTIDHQLVKEMMGCSGLMARVVRGGVLRPGTTVEAEKAEMPAAARDELVERVLAAAQAAFGSYLKGAIVKGSAYKGGFIPGYSDFDLHVLVDGTVMEGPLTPRLEYAMELQVGLGGIEREPYRVSDVQVYAVQCDAYPEEWLAPLPGTFVSVYGEYPSEWERPSKARILERSHAYLAQLPTIRASSIRSFQDKSDRGLARPVRLLGTTVKPALYCGAALFGYDPIDVWTVRPLELVQWARRQGLAMESYWEYLTSAGDWEAIRDDPDRLRTMWRSGIRALSDLDEWVAPKLSSGLKA